MEQTIKSFEDACAVLGIDPNHLPEVSMLPEKHQKSVTAFYKLTIIAEALNKDWQPNWTNWNENKYYAWFEVKADKKRPSGFGFSDTHYGWSYPGTFVGSRLCFKTKELALYAGGTFCDLYKDYLLVA